MSAAMAAAFPAAMSAVFHGGYVGGFYAPVALAAFRAAAMSA